MLAMPVWGSTSQPNPTNGNSTWPSTSSRVPVGAPAPHSSAGACVGSSVRLANETGVAPSTCSTTSPVGGITSVMSSLGGLARSSGTSTGETSGSASAIV